MNEPVRILVVDDNPDILRGTARLMEQAGYTVDRAASGEEALLTAQSHRPDLLLLDHDLPGINGTEVCRQIKQDPALADTLVIIVSALHAESDQQAEGLELGADGYIGRPIGNRELLARVQAYVRIQRLTRSLHLQAEELQRSNEAATQAHLATRRLMADVVAARERLEMANQALLSENTARKLAEAALRVHQVELEMQAEELRRSQAALDAARARYFDLYDLAPVGYVTVTEQGLILESNLAAATLLGVGRSELVQQPLSRFILPEEQDTFHRHRLQLLETGAPQAYDLRMARRDGTPFWAHLAATVAPEKDGAATLRIVISNITAQRLAEAAAEEALRRLQKIASRVPGAVYQFRLGPEGTTSMPYASDGFREIYRISPEEVREDVAPAFVCHHPDDRAGIIASIQESARDLTPWRHEFRVRFADGTVRWLAGNALPQREADGATLWHGFITDITERRQGEAALRESNELIRQLLQTTDQGIYGINRDGGCTFINRAGLQALGYQLEECLGKNMHNLIHHTFSDGSPYPVAECPIFRAKLTGIGCRVDNEALWRKDGSSFPVEYSSYPILVNGEIRGAVVTFADITERQQAQVALRESEAKLRSVIDCSPVPLAINDEQGNITYVNREFTKTFGYELGDIPTLAAWWQKAYPDPTYQAEAKTQWQLRLNQALQEGTAFEPVEVNIRCQDGAQRIAMVGAAALTGTFAGTHLVVLYDITERKQMEAANARLATAVEQAGETIVITDTSGTILYANPAFEQTCGYTRAEAIGQNPRLLKSGKQDAEFYRQMWEVLKRGQVWHGHFSNKRKDGKLYEEEATISPVRDATGTIVNYVAVKRDVTRELELEVQFRQAQKLEAIGQLAGGIAHDFNNILAAILGNAQLAVADTDPSHPARESLEEILKAGVRAKGLVQQILTFSRKQLQNRQVISLEPIIAEAAKFLHATIPSGVEIVLELAASAPPVLADATQIHQVIFNLCTNAWHALEDRPGRIDIELQTVTLDAVAAERLAGLRPGRFACLSISDTGKGMDAATLEHIFNPFFTTKAPGKGTGLGLSVVQGIVAAHDGAITVVSQPGQGTTFQVYFPAAFAGTADSPIAPEGPVHHGQGQHVLFLDDEEALVFLATRTLEWLGYRATGFTDAADAVQAFRANPGQFDVVVTDLNMPSISGLDVARELLIVRPDVPVLLCSGHVTEQMHAQALLAGIRHVLYKPNTMEELSATLRHLFTHPRPTGPKL
jgi:PAS domain S-box-containing protein